jgi:hypothetical protein
MNSPLARLGLLLRQPEFRLALLAWTTAAAVQTGTLNGDTMRRLHVAHALWTKGEPTVSLEDTAIRKPNGSAAALVGRGGKLYAWNGVGQSLVLLPADLLATGAGRALGLDGESAARFRYLVVAYLVFPLIAAATIFFAFRLLTELGFSPNRAQIGCLGLLFGCTFLPYCQNQEDNSLLFLCFIAGTHLQLRWLETDSTGQLVVGTGCLGFNLLVRLTSVIDTFFVSLFVSALLARRARTTGGFGIAARRAAKFVGVSALVYGVYLGIDRLYHFARFESWTGTFYDAYAEQKGREWQMPAAWPWGGEFWVGFLGPLRVPFKNVFTFDPLLVLLIVLVLGSWKIVRPIPRLWLGTLLALFVADLLFYARLAVWGADPSWGCRYHLAPIWLMCLITLPLLDMAWDSLGWPRRLIARVLIAAAVAVQLSALTFHYYLEYEQGLSGYAVGWRFVNIVAFATGRMHQWGLDNGVPDEIEQAMVPNLTPFRLAYRHHRSLALIAWPVLIFLITMVTYQLAVILRSVKKNESDASSGPSTVDASEKKASMLPKTNSKMLGRSFLLATSLGISVILCEAILRVFAPQAPSWLPVYRPYDTPPYYGLGLNLRYICDTGESRWLICTNSVGHRTPAEAPKPIKAEAARALFIGDSFTFGHGVNYEDSFAGILDQSEPEYQFTNAGVGAYGPVEYRQVLEQEIGTGPPPQFVLVTTFLGNDLSDCMRQQISSPEWITSHPGGLRSWIKRNTHVYRLISRIWHQFAPASDNFSTSGSSLFTPMSWEEGDLKGALLVYEQELARIAEICTSRKIALCACIIPIKAAVQAADHGASGSKPLGSTVHYELPARKVGSVFEKLRIPYVDITLTLARLGAEKAYFRHDGHLTPQGNRAVAEEIRRKLLHPNSQMQERGPGKKRGDSP